jgi:hypothetical protein
MSAWTLVPCLVALRGEFNAVSPKRDKGADGSIGDSSHTSTSDHTPDEDSDALRDHDPDSKNEVHALDIDSSGPWPEPGWFDRTIKELVAREKAEYESATVVGRLKYVIWNRRIAERSNGWAWRAYTLADPHTNHAHFSARYTTAQENDTRPWGVLPADDKENDVALGTDKIKLSAGAAKELGGDYKAGTEISGETALNLLLIYAARADDKAAGAREAISATARTLGEGQAAIDAKLRKIDEWLTSLGTPSSVEQTAALLHAVLGPRSNEVGRLLATYED